MKIRKTSFYLLTMVISTALLLAGCGNNGSGQTENPNTDPNSEGRINVVTSFYPLYDFVQKIGGEHVDVTSLVPAGVEPHDWTPKSRDITSIRNADVFVYQGADFEVWVDSVMKTLDDSEVVTVEASHGIEMIPGSGHSHDEEHEEDGHSHGEGEGHGADDHGHDHDETAGHGEDDHGHDHSHELDPHMWLSPQYAKQMSLTIKEALVQADPDNEDAYENNYNQHVERLDQLHANYKESLADLSRREIVVSHQAFGYLAHEYDLEQISIMGLSADAEPTAQDMKNIRQFVQDNGVKYIFFEELLSDSLANTLARDAGVETLVLNPLEGLTPNQMEAGEDYFSIMEQNLENLLLALK